jgi:hypothetical protein
VVELSLWIRPGPFLSARCLMFSRPQSASAHRRDRCWAGSQLVLELPGAGSGIHTEFFSKNTGFFSKNTRFFSKPHFIPDISPNHTGFTPNFVGCTEHCTRLFSTVLWSVRMHGSQKIIVIGYWRRRSTRKATKSHMKTISNFSPNHTGFFPKYRIFLQPFVWLDVMLRMPYRIFL